jgi:enamine deaminase RidA (YjgF/YER057c/UK114 family)
VTATPPASPPATSPGRSRNAALGLAGAGATFADVVRLRFFLTDASAPDRLADFMAGIELVAEELSLPQPLPPVSVIGVDFLFEPDVLVELEAYAVLD